MSDASPVGSTYSANWDVTDIQVKSDSHTLDSNLENEYASHLLTGKTLPLNFSTWNHTNQSTGGDKNFSTHVTRALTRLKPVFITLQMHDSNPEHTSYKHVNTFWHPMGSRQYNDYALSCEHQVWLQVGSKLFPE